MNARELAVLEIFFRCLEYQYLDEQDSCQGRRLRPDWIASIYQRGRCGDSPIAIASGIGCAPATVRRYLRQKGQS